MTIYERYCTLLRTSGKRNADVAKATGIGKSTFSDWKSGRSVPKNEKLQKIADYFGVPLSYFYEENDTYPLSEDVLATARDIAGNPSLKALFDSVKDADNEYLQRLVEQITADRIIK